MARASTYFYDGNDGEKQTLHRRIRPSVTQFEEQQNRWNALRDYLAPKLRKVSGYPIKSWLQGSYKFGTQIRPVRRGNEFDIDLGIYYCWAGTPEDGNYSAKELKSFVQDALKDFADENDDVTKVTEPPKQRCCRIHFKGEFHIDTPAYHLAEDDDLRSLAAESDDWESSDPKALYTWFTSEFDDYRRDRARRLIRYLKAWAALNFDKDGEPPSSVLLTVLVANAVSDIGDALPGAEDEAFREVITRILGRISTSHDVHNPVDDTENLAARMSAEGWSVFVENVRTLDGIAEVALDSQTEADACNTWANAFEHLFPLPDHEELEEDARNLPVLRTLPDVLVHAFSRDNRRFQYDDRNQIGPIPKNCDIIFRITNANQMSYGTQFVWVVRNEGDEAEEMNDLGHKAGTGLRAEEHSAYNGTHYMDCTAVAAGRIVGIRRVRVTIRDKRIPKRNPRKPAYVTLRGRR